jgi:CDP-glycerol glycerophosphotransferase
VHRLTGWLVEQGRRDEATLVVSAFLALGPGERLPRVEDARGRRLEVPGLDARTVPFPVLALRDHER